MEEVGWGSGYDSLWRGGEGEIGMNGSFERILGRKTSDVMSSE